MSNLAHSRLSDGPPCTSGPGPIEHPEPAALGIAIQKDLDRSSEPPAKRPFSCDEWRTSDCQPDALEDLRSRGVCGLRIEDHFYEMRHQQARINTARHLLALCAEKARRHPQLENALLVNQLILSGRIGRQKNPLAIRKRLNSLASLSAFTM